MMGRQAGDVFTPEQYLAIGGQIHAPNHVQGRGLACTIRADQTDDLPFVYVKVKFKDGGQTAKQLRQTSNLQQSQRYNLWSFNYS